MRTAGSKKAVMAAALIVILGSGCVRSYRVHVNSIIDASAEPAKTYMILPGNSNTPAGDLQFKEFAGMLVKAMSLQGYKFAADSQPADMELYLSYGIGEPEKHVYSYDSPVWGQTGVNIYSQTDTVSGKDNNSTQYSSTFMEPQYGVTGYTTQTGEYTTYKKFIIIDAYDIRNGKPGMQLKEMWKTSIAANGKTQDLRKIFPGLLAAAAQYIGKNTGEELVVEITEDSPALKAIKGL